MPMSDNVTVLSALKSVLVTSLLIFMLLSACFRQILPILHPSFAFYRSQQKLRGGDVFTVVCQSFYSPGGEGR